jgi:hypothetical protein
MKNAILIAVMTLSGLGLLSVPAHAQTKTQTAVYVGQEIRYGVGDWRRTTNEREATKARERVDHHQIEARRDVELAGIEAQKQANRDWADVQVEVSRNDTAARVYEIAATTGTSGTATARNGQVTANVVKIDPAGRNGRGPLIRVE